MARNSLDTGYPRDVGRHLRACGGRIDDVGDEPRGAIARLDTWTWDGWNCSRAEPMLNRVRSKSKALAQGLVIWGARCGAWRI